MADLAFSINIPRAIQLRQALELQIDQLVDLLNRLDGDCDFEDNGDLEEEPDREPDVDDEPSLGWITSPDGGHTWPGATDDLEVGYQ